MEIKTKIKKRLGRTFKKENSILTRYFLTVLSVVVMALFGGFMPNEYQIPQTTGTALESPVSAEYDPQIVGLDTVSYNEDRLREVTAYNVGIEAQTDSTPCIGATGEDLCEALANGEKVVATNELPLGSKVQIAGVIYTVKDRMNSRYNYRYDIAMSEEEYQRAINFGLQVLNVEII